MKNVIFIIFIVLVSMVANANDNDTIESDKTSQEVLINHKMIENFNSIEFDENTITCLDLIKSYSIDDVKLVYTAYQQGEIITRDKELLDTRLAELKSERDNTDQEVKQTLLFSSK